MWEIVGLLGENWKPESLIDSFVHGIKENEFCHPIVSELAPRPYSEFVTFHCKLRPFFLKEFDKVKVFCVPASEVAGCHGDAYVDRSIIATGVEYGRSSLA